MPDSMIAGGLPPDSPIALQFRHELAACGFRDEARTRRILGFYPKAIRELHK